MSWLMTRMTRRKYYELRAEQQENCGKNKLRFPGRTSGCGEILLWPRLLFLLLVVISPFQGAVAPMLASGPSLVEEELASIVGNGGTGKSLVQPDKLPALVNSRGVKGTATKLEVTSNVNEVKYESCNNDNSVNTEVAFEYTEYESDGEKLIKVSGRLRERSRFWRQIGSPDFIIETIEHGYVIPMYDIPPVKQTKNNKSALKYPEFVSQAISELVKLGTVEVCQEIPHVINPLTVSVQSNGKKRLILDLREVNHFIQKKSVKYEDMRTAQMFLKKGGFMYKFDLKSGYHHVDIHPRHQTFLGFQWEFDGIVKYFKFTALPFGLSSAPFIFTKVVRPLVKKWRSEGKMVIVYLDDGLGFAESFEQAKVISGEVKTDLIRSGFVPNVQKSVWEPVQALEWLGYEIDLISGIIRIPARRVQDILQLCVSILEDMDQFPDKPVKVRRLASLTGKIVSTGLVVGNMTRLMTKAMHMCIEEKLHWESAVMISKEALSEIQFWVRNISDINSCMIGPKPSATRMVYSDASCTGYGGYTVGIAEDIAQGQWTVDEVSKSSTWREMKAIDQVMKSLVGNLSNQRVKWFTDNQAVARIATQGSMKQDLQSIALDIYDTCVKEHITLEVDWIPRSKNERADFISRIIDWDDWSVSDEIFRFLDQLWGPHSIDRFSSFYNKKLPRFNSKFWNPGSEGVDAFTYDWSCDNNWLVPPISLIPRVILHLKNTSSAGTLVCPQWMSAPYWPMLFPDGISPIYGIIDIREIEYFAGMFLPGRGDNAEFIENMTRSSIIAIRFEF